MITFIAFLCVNEPVIFSSTRSRSEAIKFFKSRFGEIDIISITEGKAQ